MNDLALLKTFVAITAFAFFVQHASLTQIPFVYEPLPAEIASKLSKPPNIVFILTDDQVSGLFIAHPGGIRTCYL